MRATSMKPTSTRGSPQSYPYIVYSKYSASIIRRHLNQRSVRSPGRREGPGTAYSVGFLAAQVAGAGQDEKGLPEAPRLWHSLLDHLWHIAMVVRPKD